MSTEHIWLGVGLAGQALFFGRFLVQWIASERRKQSVVYARNLYFIHRLGPVAEATRSRH